MVPSSTLAAGVDMPKSAAAARAYTTAARFIGHLRNFEAFRDVSSALRAAAGNLHSLRLLDLLHRELAVDAVGLEFDLVAGLDLLEHRRVLGAPRHRHSVVHVELLDRAVLDGD